MSFVLVSTTRGDELIPSAQSIVAESDDRAKLETLRTQRAKEREDYLKAHFMPWWMEAGIIATEEIQEVPSVRRGRSVDPYNNLPPDDPSLQPRQQNGENS